MNILNEVRGLVAITIFVFSLIFLIPALFLIALAGVVLDKEDRTSVKNAITSLIDHIETKIAK